MRRAIVIVYPTQPLRIGRLSAIASGMIRSLVSEVKYRVLSRWTTQVGFCTRFPCVLIVSTNSHDCRPIVTPRRFPIGATRIYRVESDIAPRGRVSSVPMPFNGVEGNVR